MIPLISKIIELQKLEIFVDIIKASFKTVADQFGLTYINSPTNPAFTTFDNLKSIAVKAECFGVYINETPCGFFALEFNIDLKTAYLERVCVLPELRHRGIGKTILNFAENYCKKRGVEKISIGIMDQNIQLKKWYKHNSFNETEIRQFTHLKFDVCFLENHLK